MEARQVHDLPGAMTGPPTSPTPAASYNSRAA